MIILLILYPVQSSLDSTLNFVIDKYNLQDYSPIYAHFTYTLKNQISFDQFKAQLSLMFSKQGKIMDSFWISQIKSQGQSLIVFQKRLTTSVLKIKANTFQKISILFFEYCNQSTFQYLSQKKNNRAFGLTSPWGNIKVNPQTPLSICSMFKIGILLIYAQEVAAQRINKSQCIGLQTINNYYLPHVDIDHSNWLKYLNKTTCATYSQIVRGMIQYSSNANTQFLIDKLGPKQIDQALEKYGVIMNTTYLVGMMMGLNNSKQQSYDDWIKRINNYSIQQAKSLADIQHNKLKQGFRIVNQDKFYLDANVISASLRYLPYSSINNYFPLLQKLNKPAAFQSKVWQQINNAFIVNSQFNTKYYNWYGTKGGSANFPNMTEGVLSVGRYASRKNGYEFNMMIVMNGIKHEQWLDRYLDVNRFILGIQFSSYFSTELIHRLNEQHRTQVN